MAESLWSAKVDKPHKFVRHLRVELAQVGVTKTWALVDRRYSSWRTVWEDTRWAQWDRTTKRSALMSDPDIDAKIEALKVDVAASYAEAEKRHFKAHWADEDDDDSKLDTALRVGLPKLVLIGRGDKVVAYI